MHFNSFIAICFLVVCFTFIQGIACKKEEIAINNGDRRVVARLSRRKIVKRNACSQIAIENGICGLSKSRGGRNTQAATSRPSTAAGGLPLNLPVGGVANTASHGLDSLPGTATGLLSTGTGTTTQGNSSGNNGSSSSNNNNDRSDDDNDEDNDDEE